MKKIQLTLAVLLLGGATTAAQQPLSGYGQTFNGMGTGSSLPADWRIVRNSNSYRFVSPWNSSPGAVSTAVDQVVASYPISTGNNTKFNCYNTSSSVDRAVGFRQRSSDYSQSIMIWMYNNLPYTVTKIDLEYQLEKYRYDTNPDGTTVKLFYTYTPNASFTESATNPATHWVGVTASEFNDPADPSNTNPSTGYPLQTQLITGISISGISVPPSGSIYFAVNFSIGDPANSGGNNAQNSQIWALDDFSIVDVLPVELVSFSALQKNGLIHLNWRTATESNNYGFEIERSMDRDSWQNIGFVEGHGTVSSPRNYSFIDVDDYSGIPLVHYRLRQIDRDGSFEYSPVVSVSISTISFLSLSSFPNPFNPSTNLRFTLESPSKVLLKITDASGREVARLVDHDVLSSGIHTVSFDAASLGSGVYFAHLITPSGRASHKLLLSR